MVSGRYWGIPDPNLLLILSTASRDPRTGYMAPKPGTRIADIRLTGFSSAHARIRAWKICDWPHAWWRANTFPSR